MITPDLRLLSEIQKKIHDTVVSELAISIFSHMLLRKLPIGNATFSCAGEDSDWSYRL